MKKSIELRDRLKRLFPDSVLTSAARDSEFVKRTRKIKPVAFFWTLVLGFGVGSERTISALRRAYERATSTTLVPSAFYDRFDESLVRFLKACLGTAMASFQSAWFELDERLQAFQDLVVTDSTVIKLHDALGRVFPGCRTNSAPAAAKLHLVASVTGKGDSTVAVSAERVGDKQKLSIGPWVKGRLLLFDLGYYKYQLFSRIERNGGYFLTRLKQNANPLIRKVNHNVRGNAVELVGQRLQDVLGRLKRGILDVEIEVEFSRRHYSGRQRRATERFRLVAIRNEHEGIYHCYVTNIPPEMLFAEEIANTYRARWEVELLFKELKSGYRLDQITSSRREVVEALIYSAVLTLLVSRALLRHVAGLVTHGASRVTAGRWWKLLANYAQELQLLVLRPPREAHTLRGLVDTFVHELVDPHTQRRLLLRQAISSWS